MIHALGMGIWYVAANIHQNIIFIFKFKDPFIIVAHGWIVLSQIIGRAD